jgi:L-alanine-DL-glutamate epimerase-like enolase superfamily enzyme
MLNPRDVPKLTDIQIKGGALYFLPVQTRVPLKFGAETLTQVTCSRASVMVTDDAGRMAEGWGETPLSVQWVWPSTCSYEERHAALKTISIQLGKTWAALPTRGHPIEIGHSFQEALPAWLKDFNQRERAGREPVPHLAALACCSPFDVATHDAFGKLHDLPTYETYSARFMNRDLAHFLEPAPQSQVSFQGKYPDEFLRPRRLDKLPAWHLVGGLDPLSARELTGQEPKDGYPTLLDDWVARDQLKCLKIKLRGNDTEWDYRRVIDVAAIAIPRGVDWLSADFNCTVTDPAYVNTILDRLRDEQPRIYGMILYVEQPFPYDLDKHRLDVHSVSGRKPLFLDESAHDWHLVRLGRQLGWSGVALKTCKTQTGALLSACWAKAHGMSLMVQDLTNPMLAQIPHVLLAAHVETIMGVETNAMQFYPAASQPEAAVHPGLYRRSVGEVCLATVQGPGFGYRLAEINRSLPDPVARFLS